MENQETYVTTFTAEDDEWWTPRWLALAARSVLGEIHLDPASSPDANYFLQAQKIYTREDNGLEQHWYGKVFLNPPSKRGDKTGRPSLWAKKLDEEFQAGGVTEAILVVKSVLGYKWYEKLYRKYWVCHLEKRPYFVRPDSSTPGQAKKGVSVFYFGTDPSRFCAVFREYGRIIPPEGVLI